MKSGVKNFVKNYFRHFNARILKEAAEAYVDLINSNGKMMITLAGAMSTAELGSMLAEMIRQDKVHAICTTGANLEEDIFNLVGNKSYLRIKDHRAMTPEKDAELLKKGYNRVTDTGIPEQTIRVVEKILVEMWKESEKNNMQKFPHEYIYALVKSGKLKEHYAIDSKESWIIAACEKNLPIFVPGWEDSTLGNVFAASVAKKKINNINIVKNGVSYMLELIEWYKKESAKHRIGFFQIGGGIAGDFPICVVPLIEQDMKESVPKWAYFCQISDSTTSYGSYSGAPPNEKISWGKLEPGTPAFMIESDATIVAPLIFAYVLDC